MLRYCCTCGRTYRLDDSKAGRKVRCHACGVTGRVPSPVASGARLSRLGSALSGQGVRIAQADNYRSGEADPPATQSGGPGDIGAYLSWGIRVDLLASGKIAGANVGKVLPETAEAYCDWGLALLCTGDASAREKFAKAIRINPGFAGAHYAMGVALGLAGDYAVAAKFLAEAVRLDPQCADAYACWAAALAHLGRYAEACEKCARAVEINPELAEAYCNWGLIQAWMGNYADAAGNLDTASRLDPDLKPRVESALKTAGREAQA